jgi:hypothetical protein
MAHRLRPRQEILEGSRMAAAIIRPINDSLRFGWIRSLVVPALRPDDAESYSRLILNS